MQRQVSRIEDASSHSPPAIFSPPRHREHGEENSLGKKFLDLSGESDKSRTVQPFRQKGFPRSTLRTGENCLLLCNLCASVVRQIFLHQSPSPPVIPLHGKAGSEEDQNRQAVPDRKPFFLNKRFIRLSDIVPHFFQEIIGSGKKFPSR